MAGDALLFKNSVARQEADFKTALFVLGSGGVLNTEHNAFTPSHGLREVFFSHSGSRNTSSWVRSRPSAGDRRPQCRALSRGDARSSPPAPAAPRPGPTAHPSPCRSSPILLLHRLLPHLPSLPTAWCNLPAALRRAIVTPFSVTQRAGFKKATQINEAPPAQREDAKAPAGPAAQRQRGPTRQAPAPTELGLRGPATPQETEGRRRARPAWTWTV